MLVNKYVTGNPVPTNEKWRAVPPLQIERVEQGHQFWHGDVRRNTFRPYVRKPELEGGLPEGVTLWQSKSQVQILCRQVPAGVQLHASVSVGGDAVRFFAKSMAGFDLATVAWHVGHKCFLRHVEIEVKLQLMRQNRLYASQVLQFCGPEGIIDRGAVLWPALKMPKPSKSTDAYLKIRHRLYQKSTVKYQPTRKEQLRHACVQSVL